LDKRRKRAVASNEEEEDLIYNTPHPKEAEEGRGRRSRLVVPNKLGVDGKKLSDEGNPRKVEGRTREDPETYFPKKNNGIRQLLFIRM
jgi:hypothetical protein